MSAAIAQAHMGILEELAAMLRNAGSTEEGVAKAIEVYTLIGNMGADLDKVKTEAKALIAEIIEETGQTTWKVQTGAVSLSAPSTRVTWDTKAIDTLMRDDVDLATRLYPYRKETDVPGTMRITGAKG